MGEKFTSRVGFLIRNFRIAAEMTQKELADMRTKRIYNPKLRAWEPISGRSDFTQYRQQSRCQFLCIIRPGCCQYLQCAPCAV